MDLKCFFRLAFLLVALPAFSLTDLHVGDKVPADAEKVEGALILSSPSQFWPLWKWTQNGEEYSLGVNKEGIVKFISLDSPLACTEENIRLGDKYSDVKKSVKIEREFFLPGWAWCVVLPSGWILAFPETDFDSKTQRISGNTKVFMIFKGE